MRRTGYEPTQARSPLRLRLGLAVCGVVWGIAAAVGFALVAQPESRRLSGGFPAAFRRLGGGARHRRRARRLGVGPFDS